MDVSLFVRAGMLVALAPLAPNARHHAILMSGYPANQHLVATQQDLHPDNRENIYMGIILDIRFASLRRWSAGPRRFPRHTPIRIAMIDAPKRSSRMLMLVDVDDVRPIAGWWGFTNYRECVPREVVDQVSVGALSRNAYRNREGDLCLRK